MQQKPIKHGACEEYYGWNPSNVLVSITKDCDIDEFLKVLLMIKQLHVLKL